jgi:hypothetical protein
LTHSTPKPGLGWPLLMMLVILLHYHSPFIGIPLQGLKEPNRSVKAWQQALDTLPKENLTPGELKQREQYDERLMTAKRWLSNWVTPEVVWKSGEGKMPWDLAQEVCSQLDLSTLDSIRSSVS